MKDLIFSVKKWFQPHIKENPAHSRLNCMVQDDIVINLKLLDILGMY
jgi:hypothetical protein